ncbi:MAG: SDR family NAD(P)-dependent oxidoreductase [Ignavibacteriae bacterium]|nr:SDR family NAD(P)-dependent oxidoreductase [Ignavibacteriota bacterium]MCB9244496.1 SDR family NAD(P)-dependent oxidoreductase [Ignavibacteriales bacterium]
MKTTNNSTILITGGTSGIGKELAHILNSKGNTVIITGRNEESLEELSKEGIVTYKCDITNSADIDSLLLKLEQEHPGLNVLINNAGVQYNYSMLNDTAYHETIKNEIDCNFTGHVLLTSRLLPLLLSNADPLIANVTSALAVTPKENAIVYSATKSAFKSFTIGLRYQLEEEKARVVEIIPPVVDTNMTSGRDTDKMPAEEMAELITKELWSGKDIITVSKIKKMNFLYRFFPGLISKIIRKS